MLKHSKQKDNHKPTPQVYIPMPFEEKRNFIEEIRAELLPNFAKLI